MPAVGAAHSTSEIRIAQESTAIVARGAFNPVVFSPSWFKELDLIGVEELTDATIDVISLEISQFRMGWLSVVVTRDSLQLQTEEVEEGPRLRDAAIGVLRSIPGTPISLLGINRDSHTVVATHDALHHLGDVIAPKEIWGHVLDTPSVRSMTMWGAREDQWRGRVNIRVEPSVVFPVAVFISINDHFELTVENQPRVDRGTSFGSGDSPVDATAEKRTVAIEILSSEWESCLERANRAHHHLVQIAQGSQNV